MARARTGKKARKRKKKAAAKARPKKAAAARGKKAAAKARAKPKVKAPAPRRRRRTRVKAHKGPIQLWLPLQMPLGLLGGVAIAPPPVAAGADERAEPSSSPASSGSQSHLFE